MCVRCTPDEPGEAIGKIVSDPAMPGNRFEGYADKSHDEHKILRDVFENGDAWFRTGDLLRQDAEGYFYFVDRVGDTYRWKGENVSTTEVANMICRFPGIRDVTVYGVHVTGQEGRAGRRSDGSGWSGLTASIDASSWRSRRLERSGREKSGFEQERCT